MFRRARKAHSSGVSSVRPVSLSSPSMAAPVRRGELALATAIAAHFRPRPSWLDGDPTVPLAKRTGCVKRYELHYRFSVGKTRTIP